MAYISSFILQFFFLLPTIFDTLSAVPNTELLHSDYSTGLSDNPKTYIIDAFDVPKTAYDETFSKQYNFRKNDALNAKPYRQKYFSTSNVYDAKPKKRSSLNNVGIQGNDIIGYDLRSKDTYLQNPANREAFMQSIQHDLSRLQERARNPFSDRYGTFSNYKRSELQCIKVERSPGCHREENGCGSGFSEKIPFSMREVFTGSCNKHDVCYSCGKTKGWTRLQCDDSFKKDMLDTCECTYPGFWNTLSRVHCKNLAYSLYRAVRIFSESYFVNQELDYCRNGCINSYGSPNSAILN